MIVMIAAVYKARLLRQEEDEVRRWCDGGLVCDENRILANPVRKIGQNKDDGEIFVVFSQGKKDS